MESDPLWTRDGHLLDLALYRVLLGDEALPDEVRDHLAACEICRGRLRGQRALVNALLPPVVDLLAALWQLELLDAREVDHD